MEFIKSGAKANFNGLVNGFMIGMNMIKKLWIQTQLFIGKGDSAKHQEKLKQIEARYCCIFMKNRSLYSVDDSPK